MSDAAPEHVQRIIDFVNTRDLETGTDAIADPEGLRRWLTDRQLLPATEPVTDGDVGEAQRLREALRRALLVHHAGEADVPAEPLTSITVRLTIDASGTALLTPARGGVTGALTHVIAAIPAAQADGSWARAKACPDDACQWAFYDQSRNRSRRWCSMEVCGNREKTRTFRQRHHGD